MLRNFPLNGFLPEKQTLGDLGPPQLHVQHDKQHHRKLLGLGTYNNRLKRD